MTDDDLCYLSASRALSLFRSHELSPVELMTACLARAEATRETINATAFIHAGEALAAARRAEAIYMSRSGAPRPLEGLPLAVKDEQEIAGQVTTFGSRVFAGHVCDSTSTVVARLLEAGAVAHLRTTTPEFSVTGFTHSRQWGVTRNPWNPAFTPGGSSGGSAAALAAGMAPLATGTDIAGSVRIPASASGVVGYKPPYGRNPGSGPFSLDTYNHSGALARSVGDCLMMQNLMKGPSPADPAALPAIPDIAPDRRGIRGLRIAYSPDLGAFPVDAEVRRNTAAALEVLRGLGAQVEEVGLDWGAEIETAAKAHYHALFGQWLQAPAREAPAEMTDYVLAFAEVSRQVTGADVYEGIATEARMYARIGMLFEAYDLLVCPTLAVPSIPAEFDMLREKIVIEGREVDPWLGWLMTYPFNMLSRCPVLSLPSGHAASGVPTGVQFVARPYADADVFRAAFAYETAMGGWYTAPDKRPLPGV